MNLRTLKSADIKDKIVLYRSPYDIGLSKDASGKLIVKDDSRIRATLPTLEYLLNHNCKIVILTWVKRPDGKVVEELRTKPHAERLAELLSQPVDYYPECVGEGVQLRISRMQPRNILMLENTRFHAEDMEDNDEFAMKLVRGTDIIVFDAFPQSHRASSSVTGIMRHKPSVAGLYLEQEVKSLSQAMGNTEHPFTLVIGGIKISDKVDAIRNLASIADSMLIGGGVANVFLKALGKEMGASYIEETAVNDAGGDDWVQIAKEIMDQIGPSKIRIPMDLVIGDDIENPTKQQIIQVNSNKELVPDKWLALDIGPETATIYADIISHSKTVFWNGPMGLFETAGFEKGTAIVANAISEVKQVGGFSVASGGDTIEAVNKFGDPAEISHVSLAGGATLEFISGKKLPALEMLKVA